MAKHKVPNTTLVEEYYQISDDEYHQTAGLTRQPLLPGHENPLFKLAIHERWATAKEWRQFLSLCIEEIDKLAPAYEP